jgi:pimeloyl-ACP methyl ester carboxylesterase
LVAFPRTDRLRGVVSFQHGTASQRSLAPSTPDPNNGVLASAAFAGRGYLLLAPDYVGLGSSTERHAYLHADSEADAVVDLLRAARGVVAAAGVTWPDALLLTGFSQGGHATLAAQRSLEAAPLDGLTVVASAPIAGPFDLASISLPFALEGRSNASSLYLAYMVSAYANIYGESLGSALREPYASTVPGLFDGTHDGEAIIAALPANPREMFRDDFLRSYEHGEPNWLRERLIDNGLYEWSPRAPIRLYFGSRDVDVSPREAEFEARRLRERGGDVTTVDVGAVDHERSVLDAVPVILGWFDELTPQTAR